MTKRKVVPTTLLNALTGLTEDQAFEKLAAEGYRARVTSRDGKGMVVTCDYRLDRANLAIEDGLVTSARVG